MCSGTSGQLIPDDPAVFTPLASRQIKSAKDGLRRYKHLLAQTLIVPVVARELTLEALTHQAH